MSNFRQETTLLSKEINLYRHEYYSCMTSVAMGQNLKTYPTTKCRFLLILPYSAVPPECNVLKMLNLLVETLLVVCFTDILIYLDLQT